MAGNSRRQEFSQQAIQLFWAESASKITQPHTAKKSPVRILADNLDHFQEIVDLIKRILNRDKQPEAT